ncbi:hypothetical protein MPTK1_3g12850 [Marchantia polymorpha subsp. ruderalis]|uniref:Uncharacterized protein n=2 Tax=Marchantia polymorpha TaxID=3197 RepID=A0AAF6B074_MARPO|nr:hypothetical protein MARPO_0050s0077 [Marchantia polymorpha]BBN05408.1 hypothetical protein Mp_3g12850 [Marchantia polymorpha subsp. ruderalis]|eukprot:PTQ38621.1 hypothetical protein MARPO_0050s0077 [Marchantia polymorpha]
MSINVKPIFRSHREQEQTPEDRPVLLVSSRSGNREPRSTFFNSVGTVLLSFQFCPRCTASAFAIRVMLLAP